MKPAQILISLLLIGGILTLAGYFKRGDPSTQRVPNTEKVSITTKQGYIPTDKEQKIIYALILEDYKAAVNGEKSSSGFSGIPLLTHVTSDQMQLDYEQDEVTGDRKYRNRRMILSGMVLSIDRGGGENYFVGLRGGRNPYINPKAKMADGLEDYLTQLSKGDVIHLTCTGAGMLLGSATVGDCRPFNMWIKNELNIYMNNLGERILNKDSHVIAVTLIAIIAAPDLCDSSACFVEEQSKECAHEVQLAMNAKDKYLSELQGAANKLQINLSDMVDNKFLERAEMGRGRYRTQRDRYDNLAHWDVLDNVGSKAEIERLEKTTPVQIRR